MRRLTPLFLVALLLSAGVGAGWWFKPDPPGVRLVGNLLAVGYAPGCEDSGSRVRSFMEWWRAKVGEPVIRFLWPAPLWAKSADCRVYQVSWMPNVIVNAGENYLVQLWLEGVRGHRTLIGGGAGGGTSYPAAISDFRYHACGSEDTATAEAHTGLVSECTTQTDANNVRQYGTQVVGASSNIYRTVATINFDATDVITEWGLFHTSAVNSGHMWSRVVVTPGIGVNSGDSITWTYDLTIE